MFAKRIQHVSHRCASFLALHRSCASQRVPKVWFRHAPSVVSPVIAPDPFISHAGDARFLPFFQPQNSLLLLFIIPFRAFDERGGGVLEDDDENENENEEDENGGKSSSSSSSSSHRFPFSLSLSFALCEVAKARRFAKHKKTTVCLFSALFFCSLLFCVFPFFSFFFFFSFFRVIRVVFCVFFPTYKKTSLSPLLCYYTFERRRRRRKTMEAPSTSDFEEEEDEAEIAERGARAWHFFSRRVCIFRFVVANTHAREEREQSVMSVLLRVRERRRSNPALVGVVQCKLSLSLSFEFTSAAVPFPSNAFRFCDRRRIAMRAHKKGARVVLNGTRRTRFPKERKEQSRRRM